MKRKLPASKSTPVTELLSQLACLATIGSFLLAAIDVLVRHYL